MPRELYGHRSAYQPTRRRGALRPARCPHDRLAHFARRRRRRRRRRTCAKARRRLHARGDGALLKRCYWYKLGYLANTELDICLSMSEPHT